jgi:8-oxo-dGTP diphosphatase
MTRYVAGLSFSSTTNIVALIRKNKPEWQKGKLNAIGGKIEEGETPEEAMIREFKEETSVTVNSWREFLVLLGFGYEVHFFVTELPDTTMLNLWPGAEDEIVDVYDYNNLPADVVTNLRWIIPMAIDPWLPEGTVTETH